MRYRITSTGNTVVADVTFMELFYSGDYQALPDIPVISESQNDIIYKRIKQREDEENMPRATREFMILFMESSFTTEQLVLNPGYQAVKAFDLEIQALRDQIV
jgi:hypothetical protein